MPRIRSLKPEFWTSEAVAEWHVETRLVFVGLLTLAEDNGVGVANPRLIASQLFPMDDPAEADRRTQRALTECSRGGQITLYEAAGKRLYYVTGWDEHQRVNRASRTRFPRPGEDGAGPLTSDDDDDTEPSPPTHDSLTESSLSPHAGIGGMGEGEGCRGSGGARAGARAGARSPAPARGALFPKPKQQPTGRDALPDELLRVVEAWEGGAEARASMKELRQITGSARERFTAGVSLDDVIAGAAVAGADGGFTDLTRGVHKARARRREVTAGGTTDQRVRGWQALKSPPPVVEGEVPDAEVIALPRAAGGEG